LSRQALIVLLFISLSSCSVTDKALHTITGAGDRAFDLNDMLNQNISNNDFVIKRAVVTFKSGNSENSFIAGIKFKWPCEWLISLRGNSGIEAFRIFVDKDTLLANDRINRTLYYGQSNYLEYKFGTGITIIPVLLGDFINGANAETVTPVSSKGENKIVQKYHESTFEYSVDSKLGKTKNTKIFTSINTRGDIKFERFIKIGGSFYPTFISANLKDFNATIRIRKKDFDFKKIDNIVFIPGKGYERKLLK
jgi:hypothetical protein